MPRSSAVMGYKIINNCDDDMSNQFTCNDARSNVFQR